MEELGTPDEEITTDIDVSAMSDRKYDSLLAHASQSDNLFFLKMGRDVFSQVMGREAFVRRVEPYRHAHPGGRPVRRVALTGGRIEGREVSPRT